MVTEKDACCEKKLANESLKEKREIIHHIEKRMANKEVPKKFELPKNAIWTWMKNKEKLFSALQETSSSI